MGNIAKEIILDNDRYIRFEQISWRAVAITSNCAEKAIQPDLNGNLVSVEFDGLYKISLNDTFDLEFNNVKHRFTIRKIIVDKNNIFMVEASRNNTSKMLIPVLRLNSTQIGTSYLVNAYIRTQDEQNTENKYIYLVYKYIDTPEFKKLETFLKSNKYFINTTEPNYSYTIYKFLIESSFYNDIERFIEGKYSKFSEPLKRLILKYHKTSKESDIGRILYRDKIAVEQLEEKLGMSLPKDMDIFSKINIEDETFYYER